MSIDELKNIIDGLASYMCDIKDAVDDGLLLVDKIDEALEDDSVFINSITPEELAKLIVKAYHQTDVERLLQAIASEQ